MRMIFFNPYGLLILFAIGAFIYAVLFGDDEIREVALKIGAVIGIIIGALWLLFR
ncbi:hypothetical protein [Aliivibrio sifiae]|uniref:Uncharacterized protein n=1 Tax=Aliivibrio sifiae TaxID=566293 RepID=A0ABQ6ALQ7_9GAMM|nr:hypothetical protein [Aliivibrio sifiae]GLR77230.1 hypothetical protein GCM10007855_41050 [Aliivibrio sifiae]